MSNSGNNHFRERFKRAVQLNHARRAPAAIAILRSLLKTRPNDPAILGYLAGIHYRSGRFDESSKLFRRVTKLSPNSELAARGLAHSLIALGKRKDAVVELRRFLAVRHLSDLQDLLDDLTHNSRRTLAKSA
jgi:predicted Zn-dependent protease